MAMIEAYKIGVDIVLGGDLAGVIEALIPSFDALDAHIASAKDNAKELSSALSGVGGSAAGIGRAADNMGRLAEAMASMNAAIANWQSGGGMPEFVVPRARAGGGASRASGGALVPGYFPNFAMPGPEHDAPFFGDGEHGPPIPLYPNGRRGNASQPNGGSLHDVATVAIGGGIASDVLKHIFGPAIDLERTTDVLSADTRLTPEQVRAAVARAKETSALVPGSVSGENMASLLDLKTVFGSLDEAEKLLPDFARMTKVLQLLDKKNGGNGQQPFAAAKAMEALGEMVTESVGPNGETIREMDPERGMQYLQKMQRVAIATNMRVSPKDYLQLAKSARVAGLTLSDDFIYEKIPALLQTEGASRTGTALMSLAQVFQGNTLTKKSMGALIGLGLASPDGLEHVAGHIGLDGKMVGWRDVVHPDAVFDRDILNRDPLEWVHAAQGRMEAKGIHGTQAQIDALMSASQRSTIAGILAVLLKDAPAIQKEQTGIRNTDPNATKLADDSTAASVLRMQAAMHNMLTELGSAALGDAGKSLDGITSVLNSIGKWAGDHPDGTRAALEGLAFAILALGASKVKDALVSLSASGGKGSLYGLAGGILALSGAMDKFPEWLQGLVKGATVGGMMGGLPGAVVGGAIGAGSTVDTQSNLDRYFKAHPELNGDGGYNGSFGHDLGHLLHLNSYHPQADQPAMIQPIHITFEADGRELTRMVTQQQLRWMGGNVSGTLRPDPSIAPQYGSHLLET